MSHENLNWYGPQIQESIKKQTQERLKSAAIYLQRYAKKLISIEGISKVDATRAQVKRRALKKKTAGRRKITRFANKLGAKYNKFARKTNKSGSLKFKIGSYKNRRVTKTGKITSRRKARRKKP